MTIQPPPNDDIRCPQPDPIDDTPDDTPIDTPQEPEQRAPGEDQPPMGAPRDEPDADLASTIRCRWGGSLPSLHASP